MHLSNSTGCGRSVDVAPLRDGRLPTVHSVLQCSFRKFQTTVFLYGGRHSDPWRCRQQVTSALKQRRKAAECVPRICEPLCQRADSISISGLIVTSVIVVSSSIATSVTIVIVTSITTDIISISCCYQCYCCQQQHYHYQYTIDQY